MTAIGDSLSLTDRDVDVLTCEFLNSQYAEDVYADWPLDRRLEGFLRHRDLARAVDDGDTYNVILKRVMAYISPAHRPPCPKGATAG